MKSNFKKGKQIQNLDELYGCKFIIFDWNGFYKVYHNGWFNSWQVRNCMDLISRGCLFKAEKVKGNSVLLLEYSEIKNRDGYVYCEMCYDSDNDVDFTFVDKEQNPYSDVSFRDYKPFRARDYVDALNLGIRLASNGIAKVRLRRKDEIKDGIY